MTMTSDCARVFVFARTHCLYFRFSLCVCVFFSEHAQTILRRSKLYRKIAHERNEKYLIKNLNIFLHLYSILYTACVCVCTNYGQMQMALYINGARENALKARMYGTGDTLCVSFVRCIFDRTDDDETGVCSFKCYRSSSTRAVRVYLCPYSKQRGRLCLHFTFAHTRKLRVAAQYDK